MATTVHHAPWVCFQYLSERDILRRTMRSAGRPATSLRDILFPPGAPGLVRLAYRFLLAFLRNTGLDMRLYSIYFSVIFFFYRDLHLHFKK